MPKKLSRLRINEGSLVDRPANPGASVLLWKRAAEEVAKDAKTFLEAVEDMEDRRRLGELWDKFYAFEESVRSITEDDDVTDKPALIAQSIEQFQAAIAGLVPALAKGDTMPAKTDDLAKQLEELEDQIGELTKANAELSESLKAAKKSDPAPEPGVAEAALLSKVEELTEKLKAAEEKLAKHEPPAPEDEINLSDLPASVRRRLEDAENRLKKSEETEQLVAKLVEERKIERCATKIAKHWPSLPIKAENFAPIYSKIEQVLKKDELKELEGIFTSHAQAMKIASSQLGREYVTSDAGAWAEIESKAAALRQVDPKMTQEQAIAETVERFPDLYKRYDEEKRQSVQ